MKVLVIPDVHLKPKMFYRASAIMHQGIADRAVCRNGKPIGTEEFLILDTITWECNRVKL